MKTIGSGFIVVMIVINDVSRIANRLVLRLW